MSDITQFILAAMLKSPTASVSSVTDATGTINQDTHKAYTVGAMTAGVLKSILSVTGAGVLYSAYLKTILAGVRTSRLQIVLDGRATPFFDITTAALNGANFYLPGAGILVGNTTLYPEFLPFNKSLEILAASSVTETDPFTVYARYRTV